MGVFAQPFEKVDEHKKTATPHGDPTHTTRIAHGRMGHLVWFDEISRCPFRVQPTPPRDGTYYPAYFLFWSVYRLYPESTSVYHRVWQRFVLFGAITPM